MTSAPGLRPATSRAFSIARTSATCCGVGLLAASSLASAQPQLPLHLQSPLPVHRSGDANAGQLDVSGHLGALKVEVASNLDHVAEDDRVAERTDQPPAFQLHRDQRQSAERHAHAVQRCRQDQAEMA